MQAQEVASPWTSAVSCEDWKYQFYFIICIHCLFWWYVWNLRSALSWQLSDTQLCKIWSHFIWGISMTNGSIPCLKSTTLFLLKLHFVWCVLEKPFPKVKLQLWTINLTHVRTVPKFHSQLPKKIQFFFKPLWRMRKFDASPSKFLRDSFWRPSTAIAIESSECYCITWLHCRIYIIHTLCVWESAWETLPDIVSMRREAYSRFSLK